MQPHTKVYMNYFNFTEADFVPCELCNSKAVDIHHIVPRSRFGSKRKAERDDILNLMALCRICHNVYGQSKAYNDWLQLKHENYIVTRHRLN